MKAYPLLTCAFVFVMLADYAVHAQFRVKNNRIFTSSTSVPVDRDLNKTAERKWSLPGLARDKDAIVYKPVSPAMSLPANTSSLLGDSYWIGSVTSQSYNQGKIGRYYYWDVQGNLRGSYLFLDIAGKNKRGLKLVFPRHRAIF